MTTAVILAVLWFGLFCAALAAWLRLRTRCLALEQELELMGAMYYERQYQGCDLERREP